MRQKIDVSGFWRYLSNFFNYLNDQSRSLWEFFWEGMTYVSNEMSKQAARFVASSAPTGSYVSPTIDYYDLLIDILKAKPMNPDPTKDGQRYYLIAKGIVKSSAVASGRQTVFNDMVELGKIDYDAIRNIAIGQYLVINNEKYYTISDMLGPTEIGPKLYDRYVIKLNGANLSVYENVKISVYVTSGKAYAVSNDVIDIPQLSTTIADKGRVYTKGEDYEFRDGYVEFNYDEVGLGHIVNGSYLYGKNVPVMESNLFNSFGALVDIRHWKAYNYDNIGTKIAINSLLKGMQNPSNDEEYERCLNVYYGLPVAPEDAEVIGLFESYDYEVVSIAGSTVTLALKYEADNVTPIPLHNFIQPGTKFSVDGTDTVVKVDYPSTVNRAAGEIAMTDTSDIVVGSKLNIKLANRLSLSLVSKPASGPSFFVAIHHTDGGEFQHVQTTNTDYPEFLVYDSETIRNGSSFNKDSYYHFKTCAISSAGYIKFTIDDDVDPDLVEPKYNDYVDLEAGVSFPVVVGKLHMPWPTHKYLLLRLPDGTLYKCYIDSPMDTIYDTGDKVSQYQVLCRCLSVTDQKEFVAWNEFLKSNGIDLNSNMLEIIYTIPKAKFGVYYPN